jgi:hypothetical protein
VSGVNEALGNVLPVFRVDDVVDDVCVFRAEGTEIELADLRV